MKLAAILAGVAITLFFATGFEALAGAQPPHATGEGAVSVGATVWNFSFDAHDGDPADQGDWGSAHLSNTAGRWLDVRFRCVVVSGPYAYMAGPVTATNVLRLSRRWVYAVVYDNGEPGIGADQAGGNFMIKRRALQRCANQTTPQLHLLTEGNLQVHD